MVTNFAETLWDKLYNKFDNEICRSCYDIVSPSRDMTMPQPIPWVGSNFSKDERRLMFVCIESYSYESHRKNRNQIEYEEFGSEQVELLFFGDKKSGVDYSPFWQWARIISTEVLATNDLREALSRIAYSNLHKCQARKQGSDRDKTNYQIVEDMSIKCIKEARWIFREIAEIGAKNIVIFAGRKNDYSLARLFLNDENGNLLKKFNYENYDYLQPFQREKRKNKDLFVHMRDRDRRFIVTNHPQGTPNEVRDEIIRIITQNDWKGSTNWRMPIHTLG